MLTQGHNIADKVREKLRSYVIFDKNEHYDTVTLWILTTRFLQHHRQIPAIKYFPRLFFVGPEPGCGKTKALEITQLLSHNAQPLGMYTPATMLAAIDNAAKTGKKLSFFLDDVDSSILRSKDNADVIPYLNVGYKAGATVNRLHRFKHQQIDTDAFFPIAMSGLSVAKIPPATAQRTLFIWMRPAQPGEEVLDDLDETELDALNKEIDAWSVQAIEKLNHQTSYARELGLRNRDKDNWEGMLAVANAVSGEWLVRGQEAARSFQEKDDPERNLPHRILLASYVIEYRDRSGCFDPWKGERKFEKGIHTEDLVEKGKNLGLIPSWIDKSNLWDHFHYRVRPHQIWLDGCNANGFHWHEVIKDWEQFLSTKERENVEKGIW